jgi:hypothetical protein
MQAAAARQTTTILARLSVPLPMPGRKLISSLRSYAFTPGEDLLSAQRSGSGATGAFTRGFYFDCTKRFP